MLRFQIFYLAALQIIEIEVIFGFKNGANLITLKIRESHTIF